MDIENNVVLVVGLGYVGLPLAIEFGKKTRTIGFDISEDKIKSYSEYCDPSGEVQRDHFINATKLEFTSNSDVINEADVIVIAVPTPVDQSNIPDFCPLLSACDVVAKKMKQGVLIIFESTVYPGATEEVCIPRLENVSGKKWKCDFNVGYSPERINPGDKKHGLTNIVKVVSADDQETLEKVASLYDAIVRAGVYRASCIKVAEAAKVIENTQRDLNIALMNELAIIFEKVGIETTEVLEAANTKWNFLDFKPGLVGGHCIGVDPYYLTHKAKSLGYHPEVILAGRRINDGMGKHIVERTVKTLFRSGVNARDIRAGILGLTFKENCGDLRNSQVPSIKSELEILSQCAVVV